MENLNISVLDQVLIMKLFESSSSAFCSNEVIRAVLKKNGHDYNFRVIGLTFAKFAKPVRRRVGNKVIRGWMVKYIGNN